MENTVINGGKAAANPQGSDTVRRTMKGIIQHCATNVFSRQTAGFPAGSGLDEAKINYVLRKIWEQSSGSVDLIVVGGFQKRKINAFLTGSRSFGAADTTYRDMVSLYESDFGVCRIVTTRWMPQDAVLFLGFVADQCVAAGGQKFSLQAVWHAAAIMSAAS